MPSKIRVGLIGLGRMGKIHAENLIRYIDGVELTNIVATEKSCSEAQVFFRRLGVSPFIHVKGLDAERIFKDDKIEAVVISTPTDTHAEIVIAAIKAGKHVFCEKPISFKYVELAELDKAISENQDFEPRVQVGFNRRFDPDFFNMKRIVGNGTLGKIRKIKIISRDPYPPGEEYLKNSGGIFMDMTIHDFDMLCWLADSAPREIFATGIANSLDIKELGDIDTAETIIVFENGIIGTIDNCRYSVDGYDQRIEVVGDKGKTFNKNHLRGNVSISLRDSTKTFPPKDFFKDRYKESFVNELQAFFGAIRENKSVRVGVLDDRRAFFMAKAAQKSLKKNRPVKIDLEIS
ncbi:MAG: Gfo/Idh/MocA family oxidoreductase [Patescibacteria group bacterium]